MLAVNGNSSNASSWGTQAWLLEHLIYKFGIFPGKSLTWIGLAISWIAHAKTIFALNDATKFLFSAFLKYSDTIIMPCKESSHIHSSLIGEEHQ